MAKKERFFEGIVDYTPYWAWAPVVAIAVAVFFGGAYGLWHLGGYVKHWHVSLSVPSTDDLKDSASKAANDLAEQAKQKAQSAVEEQKQKASDQARAAIEAEAKAQVDTLKNNITVPNK